MMPPVFDQIRDKTLNPFDSCRANGGPTEMMTAAMLLLTLSCIFLWWNKAQWVWLPVMAALIIGIAIFVQDVDFSTNLGVQL